MWLPANVAAGEIDAASTWKKHRMKVAADPLVLRERPSRDAAAVVEAPLLESVALLGDSGPTTVVDGRPDKWVRVAVAHCVDKACKRYYAGWVPESRLARDDSFEPLGGRAPGRLIGYSGNSAFLYAIEPDGRFTRWSVRCVAGACSMTPGVPQKCADFEETRDDFCVVSGRLYRYRIAVRGRAIDGKWLPGVNLKRDASGEICAYRSERNDAPRMCERSGPFAASAPDPKAALAAVMLARRKRLALVAADMLNVRKIPAADAEIVTRAPRGSQLAVLELAGPAISLGAQPDHWVKVRVHYCYSFSVSGLCAPGAIGWVVDGYLAYERRLKPVTDWRAGMIGGYGGDYIFSYLFREDGGVEFTESCGDYREGRSCTVEGRLYRYRDLVLARFPAKGRQDILSIDAKGRLCFPPSDETGEILYRTGDGRPTKCDR